MAEKPNPNPEEKGNIGDEETPLTPEVPEEGTEGGDQPPTPKIPPEGATPPPEKVDYKKKFGDSSRENQRIQEENAKLLREKAELEEKLKSEPPSDTELAEKHPDWEYKDDEEKARIRREETLRKDIAILKEKAAWDEDYKRILKNYPQLANQEEAFKEEAYKHPKSVNLDVIAKSFLFDNKPLEPEPEPEKPKPGLEKPTGGTGTVPSTEMTLEDITRLRETDERKYIKLVREGKIKEIPEK